MDTVRIGVIGVGIIGKRHISEYSEMPDVEIVAIADRNNQELELVSEQYHIPNTYTDYMKLLERDDLDAVDICLHNSLHAEASISAMHSGKHVYCEKPLAASYAQGFEMLRVSQNCGKMLHIQLKSLYLPETKLAKRLIDTGHLGEIYFIRCTGLRRRGRPYVDGYATPAFVQKSVSGGGAVQDTGIYRLSQMLYLAGISEVKSISGKTFQKVDMYEDRKISSGYNVEEMGLGFVRFRNDMVLDMLEAWAAHFSSTEDSMLLGNAGGLRLNPVTYYSTVNDIEMTSTPDLDLVDTRWHRVDALQYAYDSSQRHWIAALQQKVPLINTAEIALQCMLIQEGIYLSDERGREVVPEEVIEFSNLQANK
ncbi:MAG: Gfo/Idh/MocA family protein [Acetanaerobacterium sp.]